MTSRRRPWALAAVGIMAVVGCSDDDSPGGPGGIGGSAGAGAGGAAAGGGGQGGSQPEGDWQQQLEALFDHVSTFDDLADWHGAEHSGQSGSICVESFPDDMPSKSDGSASLWQYYSAYATPGDNDWIADHGADSVWRGRGKSACIDYGDGADGILRGPGRLGFKIGDTPADGYPDTVHVFFMTRWFYDFFKPDGGGIVYHRFLKTLDISAGFQTVCHWGSTAEHDWVDAQGAPSQVLHQYGINFQVYNYTQLAGSERVKAAIGTAADDNYHYDADEVLLPNSDVEPPILASEWFGIEYRVKSSDPHGSDNGEIEVWVYDGSGGEISHDILADRVTLKDGNTAFDHSWNKFVWGGNRFAGAYCPGGDPLCDFGPVDHFFIDDVIVHGSRIGPTYFAALPESP